MKDLIIVGAGGFGREVLSYAEEIIKAGNCEWRILGFLNDVSNALDKFDISLSILGPIRGHQVNPDALYIVALGDGEARLKIGRELQSKGANFINLIHPETRLRERVIMGVGNIICPGSGTSPDIKMGDFNLMNSGSGVGHDCSIGSGVTLGPKSLITGNCKIGDGVLIGAGAIITPNRKVGEYAKIGAGSVLYKHAKPYSIMIGNPAKKM